MGIFSKKVPLADILERNYHSILLLLCKSKLSHSPDFELLPAMFVITDYAAASAGKDRNAIANEFFRWARSKYILTDQNSSIFDDRTDLYGMAIRGMPLRAEWLFGNASSMQENAITICATVLGDILINPDCADDYEGAPVVLGDYFETISFGTNVMSPAIDKFVEHFKAIYNTKLIL